MKIAIAISLNPELNSNYKELQTTNWLKEAEIHLVNVFHTHHYMLGMEDIPLAYPIETDLEEIKKSTLSYLKRVAREAFDQISETQLHFHCLFSDDPKQEFCDFVNSQKVDLSIILTRKKRGFFESSFGQYVSRHSDSNVLLLKQTNEND
jgi:nucleotide-binding universal stress UspA family protein